MQMHRLTLLFIPGPYLRGTSLIEAVLSSRIHLFYVRCCSIFECFSFNTSVCPIV